MLQRILPAGKDFIKEIVSTEDKLIDATCGNGHDTDFLAGLVPDGHVYSFDVQAEAIGTARESTAKRILHSCTTVMRIYPNTLKLL